MKTDCNENSPDIEFQLARCLCNMHSAVFVQDCGRTAHKIGCTLLLCSITCATVSYTYGCMQFAAMSFIISIVVWYGFLPCQTLSSGHVDPIDAVELVDTLTL